MKTFPHLAVSNSDLSAHIALHPRLLISYHDPLTSTLIPPTRTGLSRVSSMESGIIPGAVLWFQCHFMKGELEWLQYDHRQNELGHFNVKVSPSALQVNFVNHSKLYGPRKHHLFGFILLVHIGQTDQMSLLCHYWKMSQIIPAIISI